MTMPTHPVPVVEQNTPSRLATPSNDRDLERPVIHSAKQETKAEQGEEREITTK